MAGARRSLPGPARRVVYVTGCRGPMAGAAGAPALSDCARCSEERDVGPSSASACVAGSRPSDRHANIRSYMTSHGSPYARFQRALRIGRLSTVRAAAAELPRIDLDDALAICLLIERQDGERYERAVVPGWPG